MEAQDVERTFWGLHFRIKFLEATGNEFQTFVQRILELRFPDEFKAVRPSGREGDWKSDGLLTEQRRILQIYAPESWNEARTLKKIHEDFWGAVHKWRDNFDVWTFIHNGVKGAPPYVQDKLLELSISDDTAHTCELWDYAKLRSFAFELNNEQLAELLGPPITRADFLSVEIRDIAPLLRTIEDTEPAPLSKIHAVSSDKLKSNELSSDAVYLIQWGMFRSQEVKKYFDNQQMRPTFRDDLGARFKAQYTLLRDSEKQPDEIISDLVTWIAGPSSSIPPIKQATALAIIAFFFEECDIFEDPSKRSS